jgi:hypothetical protein
MYSSEEGYRDWLLIPRGNGSFILGRLLNGELLEVINRWTYEFDLAGDRVASFEIRTTADRLIGKGNRLD